MLGRRAFVAGYIAFGTSPLRAAKAPAPPKIGAIHWSGPGHELHGYMAIPAKAHGPQPAILVLPDAGADQFALGLTDALALAGFVACVAKNALTADEAMATIRWLGSNRYATGKVGLVGTGAGATMARRIAAAPDIPLSCTILFDGAADVGEETSLLHLPMLNAAVDSVRYGAAWQQAIAFLGRHLRPDHDRSSR